MEIGEKEDVVITLEEDELVIRFPEVHEAASCRISFQRTLRVPDNGLEYPLPAGFGRFKLRHVDDFAERLPPTVVRRGGVVMPMWQAEAMWVHFECRPRTFDDAYPFAVKIATGKINAVTGGAWTPRLQRDPQDYVVLPDQPWLDGYCVERGAIRQFVAMPLGQGYSVEEQLTGGAENGGLQLVIYPMRAEIYERMFRHRSQRLFEGCPVSQCYREMGIAPGGRIIQELYQDPHGLDAWDQSHSARCFVTLLNAAQWFAVTGEAPPSKPISVQEYQDQGIPWFDWYSADQKPLPGSAILGSVKSISNMGKIKGEAPFASSVRHLGPNRRPVREANQVREAEL